MFFSGKRREAATRCELFAADFLSSIWLDCVRFQRELPKETALNFKDFFFEDLILQTFLLSKILPVISLKHHRLILDAISEHALSKVDQYLTTSETDPLSLDFKLSMVKLHREYLPSAWEQQAFVADQFQTRTIYSVAAGHHFTNGSLHTDCLNFFKEGTRYQYARLIEVLYKLNK